MEKYYKNLLTNEVISKKEKVPAAKPRSGNLKEPKQNKKDLQYEKG